MAGMWPLADLTHYATRHRRFIMSTTDKDKPVKRDPESRPKTAEQKQRTMNDALRKKLEKLKKDDPNIYPVF